MFRVYVNLPEGTRLIIVVLAYTGPKKFRLDHVGLKLGETDALADLHNIYPAKMGNKLNQWGDTVPRYNDIMIYIYI